MISPPKIKNKNKKKEGVLVAMWGLMLQNIERGEHATIEIKIYIYTYI